jgi:hypothetical protein
MFETLFSRFKPSVVRATKPSAIVISGTNDYTELPQGFFRVETASGAKSLGYNCPTMLCWQVGTTVVVGRDRITLDKPLEELPLVKLNFRSSAQGIQQVGSTGIIDTDDLDNNDGTVGWNGAPPQNGVAYR